MTDKEFEAMSLMEQMAWIGREAEKILRPLAEESRSDVRHMARPERTLSNGDYKLDSGEIIERPCYDSINDFPG